MVIKVLVLRPHKLAIKFWENLNLKWDQYGHDELVIIIHKWIKLKMLVNLRPDVIVLSDVAGCPYQFEEQQIETLIDYVTHTTNCHVLATYATFYHSEYTRVYDNRKLCYLFGLDTETMFKTRESTIPRDHPITYHIKHPCRLQTQLGNKYHSWGYQKVQVPENGWESMLNNKLQLLAQGTEDKDYVVLNYTADNYTSLYISHMPEFQTEERHSVNDCQFIYNAISFLSNQRVCSLKWLSAKVVAEQTYIFPEEVPEDIGQLIDSCLRFAPEENPFSRLGDLFCPPPVQTDNPLPDEDDAI